MSINPTFTNGTGVITNSQDSTSVSATNNSAITVTPNVSTLYTLTVANTFGFSVTATINVSVERPNGTLSLVMNEDSRYLLPVFF